MRHKRWIYKGRSMEGLFRFGDLLFFQPASLNAFKPGDVVIYDDPNREQDKDHVVHRVMALSPHGLIVQGDNNLHPDKTLVTENNLVGIVSHFRRNGRMILMPDRRIGLLKARTLHGLLNIRRGMWSLIRCIGRGPYQGLRRSRLMARVWRPPVTRIRLRTKEGPLIKYIYRNRTVAFFRPREKRLTCKKPFDLVIFEK